MAIFILLGFVSGMAIGFAMGWLFKPGNHANRDSFNKLEVRIDEKNGQLKKAELEITALRDENRRLDSQRTQAETTLKNFNDMREVFLKEFKSISNETLTTQKSKVAEEIQDKMGAIKKDLLDKMTEVDKNTVESKAALEQNLKNLMSHSNALQQEASNLTNALRGQKKLQGNWAQIQIKRIFEIAGWKKDEHYTEEEYFRDEEGGSRTDFIVNLPDERRVVIDAKFTLISYADYVNESNEERKSEYMKGFAEATRGHIKDLAGKEYQKLVGGKLDFVFMFMPLEHAYLELLNHDKDIFQFAFDRKIAIVTPSLLFPAIRMIDSMWKLDKQNKGLGRVIDYAKKLYEKFSGVEEEFIKLGNSLETAQKSYNTTMSRLKTGQSGTFYGWLEKIRTEGGVPINPDKRLKLSDDRAEEHDETQEPE